MDIFDGLTWGDWMTNEPAYYSAPLDVPASEVPDDYTVAHRPFTIQKANGGRVLLRLGPVEGQDGESYGAFLPITEVPKVIAALEVIRAQLGL